MNDRLKLVINILEDIKQSYINSPSTNYPMALLIAIEEIKKNIKREEDCEYCNKIYTEEELAGDDGICYNKNKNQYYIYGEHFRYEKIRIDIEYCPKCGRKL